MLLRLMMAVCIWMMAMMPCAWAEEADTPSEQALSALTLAVDTYQKKGHLLYTMHIYQSDRRADQQTDRSS
ncbi:MAG: hypothetical protein J6K70_01410 [Selenomonadales bacterium]|nr:hypothetical protein [Selenomonadales bacterium]